MIQCRCADAALFSRRQGGKLACFGLRPHLLDGCGFLFLRFDDRDIAAQKAHEIAHGDKGDQQKRRDAELDHS
jgi:hypothetical protein